MDNYALKSVSDLPAPFRSTFSFRYFNSLQSECFSACFLSDMNMVISAPTGSGKTVLFELCILRLLSKFVSTEGKFIHMKGSLKTIYVAPSKALVQEKLRDWNQKFGSWGINCLELTGDNDYYNTRNIQDADIILTTPEKFDAVTRYQIKDGGLSFFSDIALVLIDEVHLLNDTRGAALEAIVSRIKMLARNSEMKSCPLALVRFLAVSATIPNVEDLAEWLMVPTQGIKRFGEEMRPVKLTTKVFGYTPAKNDFLFEKRLQNYIFDILMQYSRGKSALIFCSTRKGAQEAAARLAQIAMTFGHSNPFIKSREHQERLQQASLSCGDKQMQSYILYGGMDFTSTPKKGYTRIPSPSNISVMSSVLSTANKMYKTKVGYHNGGLSLKDRNLIEGLFLSGDLQILCTTNTLAHGINLPAHTVVIKSTQHFNKEKGIYMEYDRSMVWQMCGRAGRPPFDDTGMVIIMTRRETVHLYENLLNGCEVVESQLLPCIAEHLTAEIVQLTISDITRAIEWMKCSYLYVRMKKNPENYAVKKVLPGNSIERHMQEICVQKINELSRYQMIWTDEDGFLLKPLEPGRLMTKYYLKFDTMKHIMLVPAISSIEDALHIICRAEELAWIQLRRNDKKLLNDINADKDGRLRFHILGDKGKVKKRIQTREEKIFILANDCLTGDPLVHDLSMSQDMNSICSNGCRIAKCMKEYLIHKKNYKGALSSTLLAKSLHQKLWDDSPYLLKQLPGIGMVTAKALHSIGVASFDSFSNTDPRKIEIVTGRKYPYGNHIKESLQSLPPKVEMKLEETENQMQGKSKLTVTLTRLSQSLPSTKRHYADMMVSIENDNIILFHEKIRVDEFLSPYSATVLLSTPHQGKLTVNADLIFEEFVGIDMHQKVIVRKEIDLNMIHDRGSMYTSTSQPKDVSIIQDDDKCSSQPSLIGVRNSLESKGPSDNMPSFELLDEEPEEAVAAVEDEDDCRIITERTVFDHIREKAKSLPTLAMFRVICSPPSQTSSLIKKRTLERQLELDSLTEAPEETKKIRDSRQNVVLSSAQPIVPESCKLASDRDLIPDIFIADDTGKLHPEQEHIEPEALTDETIFDHIRKKSKILPVLDNSKITGLKLIAPTNGPQVKNQCVFGNCAFDGSAGQTRALQTAVTMSDPADAMDIKRNATSGTTKVKDTMFCRSSTNGRDKMVTSIQEPAAGLLFVKDRLLNCASSGENKQDQPSSPGVLGIECCLAATTGSVRIEDSFLGFKSIFSFL